jgi:hypothetical protein
MSGESLGNDLLQGADQIAQFLFGDPARRRRVYHLAENAKLPVFRMGALLCGRKSSLLTWIADQERQSIAGDAGAGVPRARKTRDR